MRRTPPFRRRGAFVTMNAEAFPQWGDNSPGWADPERAAAALVAQRHRLEEVGDGARESRTGVRAGPPRSSRNAVGLRDRITADHAVGAAPKQAAGTGDLMASDALALDAAASAHPLPRWQAAVRPTRPTPGDSERRARRGGGHLGAASSPCPREQRASLSGLTVIGSGRTLLDEVWARSAIASRWVPLC
jgi:hypothetical protein